MRRVQLVQQPHEELHAPQLAVPVEAAEQVPHAPQHLLQLPRRRARQPLLLLQPHNLLAAPAQRQKEEERLLVREVSRQHAHLGQIQQLHRHHPRARAS